MPTPPLKGGFAHVEAITLQGYTGSAQEDPQITPDNQYLFFDSHDDKAGDPSYLYWAKRIDYKTFAFMGEVQGVNLGKGQVRGNSDLKSNFYFASTAYIAQYGGARIARGVFNNGMVDGVAALESLAEPNAPPGYFMLDGEVTPDGSTLYFDVFQFDLHGALEFAHIGIATEDANGNFTPLPNSDDLMKNVNALGTVYGSIPSDDGLTLYFTQGNLTPPGCKIYLATRGSTSSPFEPPQLVAGVNDPYTVEGQSQSPNCNEAGSLSQDGNHFYFHRVLTSTSSQIYVVSRQ